MTDINTVVVPPKPFPIRRKEKLHVLRTSFHEQGGFVQAMMATEDLRVTRVAHGAYGTIYRIRPNVVDCEQQQGTSVAVKVHRLVDFRDPDAMHADDDGIVQIEPAFMQKNVEDAIMMLEGFPLEDPPTLQIADDEDLVEAAEQESQVLTKVHQMVMEDVCPFFPLQITEFHGNVTRQFFMEYSPWNVRIFLKQTHSLGRLISLLHQQLVGIVCLNSILGICHNDNYSSNNLVDEVDPCMYRFQYDGKVLEWYNYETLVKITDFGMASGKSFLKLESSTLSHEYYNTDKLVRCCKNDFQDLTSFGRLSRHHILEFENVPAYARDIIATLDSFNSSMYALSNDHTRDFLCMYLNAIVQRLGRAIFDIPGGMTRPGDLWSFVHDVCSPEFLIALGLKDAAHILIPTDHLYVPIYEFGITSKSSPVSFDASNISSMTRSHVHAPTSHL